MDRAQEVEPLSPGQVLNFASNRFGYGISPVDSSFVPDKVTDSDLAKIAWILSAQIEDQDPTLVGQDGVLKRRSSVYGRVLSEKMLKEQRYECLDHPGLRFASGAANIPQMSPVALATAFIHGRHQASCTQQYRSRFRRLMVWSTARKELLESTFSTQYYYGGRPHDLQMNFNKVVHEFWFNHFNIDTFKPNSGAFGSRSYENMISTHQDASFRQLLGAVMKSPGMLEYLDNDTNVFDNTQKVPSNQNLGRELLELYSFGLPPHTAEFTNSPYNQVDVEVASTVLAGHTSIYSVPRSGGTPEVGYRFIAENSFKTDKDNNYEKLFWTSRERGNRPRLFNQARLKDIDGRNGSSRLDYVLDVLASHPRTQANICRKLSERFLLRSRDAFNQINSSCLAALSGGSSTPLKQGYVAILSQPALWTRNSAHPLIGNPHEVVIKNVRSLGIPFKSIHTSIEESKLLDLAQFMHTAIQRMGFDYREFGDPTGYEMLGNRWLSQGYLVNHVHLALDYAQLDEKLGQGVKMAARKLTDDPKVEDNFLSLRNGAGARTVASAVYTHSGGNSTVRNFSRAQADHLLTLRDQELLWDKSCSARPCRNRFEASLMETIHSLSKTTLFDLRK
jgi:uncharacterized protein (DUF1800 family)